MNRTLISIFCKHKNDLRCEEFDNVQVGQDNILSAKRFTYVINAFRVHKKRLYMYQERPVDKTYCRCVLKCLLLLSTLHMDLHVYGTRSIALL